jgi:hypothetical protein
MNEQQKNGFIILFQDYCNTVCSGIAKILAHIPNGVLAQTGFDKDCLPVTHLTADTTVTYKMKKCT